jgi:Zn-dependent protease with chaperone function
VKAASLAFALIVASSCGLIGSLRPGATIAPLISAAFISVHLFSAENGDAEEKARLPQLRDAIASALPNAWATATAGRGRLSLRTDADIDVELDGTNGTSVLLQHSTGGKVTSRTIAVHTLDGSRRLTVAELMATVLHELGHIWCCFAPGTKDGHWTDAPAGFSSVGLMNSPMTCRAAPGSDPVCPSVFSDRELAEMKLTAR